jgi:hypothetical protein
MWSICVNWRGAQGRGGAVCGPAHWGEAVTWQGTAK